jgi:Na+/proline symporter
MAILTALDLAIIIVYLVLSLGLGLLHSRKAGTNTSEFFTAGGQVPWWLAGLSMVATTFASDTPLAVTEIIRKDGISGFWIIWAYLIGGMLTTFFFARNWRKAGVMTDVEFVELRYSGPMARFLRGFKAVYFGLFLNTIIMGWVNLAMADVLRVFLGIDASTAFQYMAVLMFITAVYTALSGIRGVLITDAVQFGVALSACILLAILVLNTDAVGGVQGLKTKLNATGSLAFWPSIGQGSGSGAFTLPFNTFIAMIFIQWWASWYPGSEPGGGGYIAQRMFSAKNEGHALGASLLFQILNYSIRPWPWIVVALCSFILYPHLAESDYKLAYVYSMKDYLPPGLKGLLLVAFLAAYMSTISTHLNWGLSYLINDLYRKFIRSDEPEEHYVSSSRIMTLVLMGVSLAVTTQLDSIKAAWEFIMFCGAGLGFTLIARWYWWRINAWCELVATIVPFLVYSGMTLSGLAITIGPTNTYLLTVAITVLSTIIAAYVAPETDSKHLHAFYQRVQPQGLWPFQPDSHQDRAPIWVLTICWITATLLGYSIVFGMGAAILAEWKLSVILGLMAIVNGLIIRYFVAKYPLLH